MPCYPGIDLQAQRAVLKAWQQIDFGQAASFHADSVLTAVPSPAAGGNIFSCLGLPLHHPHDPAAIFPRTGWWRIWRRRRFSRSGLLIGSHIYVSHPVQVAEQSPSIAKSQSPVPQMDFVGRITGMVDCKWEKAEGGGRRAEKSPNLQISKTLVSLGDKFASLRPDGNHLRHRLKSSCKARSRMKLSRPVGVFVGWQADGEVGKEYEVRSTEYGGSG